MSYHWSMKIQRFMYLVRNGFYNFHIIMIALIILMAVFAFFTFSGCSAEGDFFENIGCQDVGVAKAHAYSLTKNYCDRCNKETQDIKVILIKIYSKKISRDGYRKEMELCIPCKDIILKYTDLFTIKMSSPPRNDWEQEYIREKLRKLSEDL